MKSLALWTLQSFLKSAWALSACSVLFSSAPSLREDPEIRAILGATSFAQFKKVHGGWVVEPFGKDEADFKLVVTGDAAAPGLPSADRIASNPRFFPVVRFDGQSFSVVPNSKRRFVRIWDYLNTEKQELTEALHSRIQSLARELEIPDASGISNFYVERETERVYFRPYSRRPAEEHLPQFDQRIQTEQFTCHFPMERTIQLKGETYTIERNLTNLWHSSPGNRVFIVRNNRGERSILKYTNNERRTPHTRNEIRILNRLSHTGRSQDLVDSYERGNLAVLLLRYHNAKPLDEHPHAAARWYGEPSRREIERFLALARRLIAEVIETHKVGIVHGDLKAGNILFREGEGQDHVRFIDWESAFVVDKTLDPKGRGVLEGQRIIYSYWPPEIPHQGGGALAKKPLYEGSFNRDWWSLGVILRELILGPGSSNITRLRFINREVYDLLFALQKGKDSDRMDALEAWKSRYWPEGPEIPRLSDSSD